MTQLKQELDNQKRLYSAVNESQTNVAQDSPEYKRRVFVMVTLWERMSDLYGNMWTLNYGEPGGRSMLTWLAGLRDYSERQIKTGVELCRQRDHPYPPNLGQFAKLCLSGPVKKTEYKQLSAPKTPEIRQQEILRQAEAKAGNCDETKAESMEKLGLNERWAT